MDEFVIIISLFIFIVGLAIMGTSYESKLDKYKEYYEKTEALIDSIASQNGSFLDTTAEQDVYIEYLEARNKIK